MSQTGLTDRAEPQAAKLAPKALRAGPIGRLRNYFLAGILVTAPIGITIWLTWSLISWVDQRVLPFIPARYNPENYLPVGVPGIGLVIAIIALTLIGFVTTNLVGRWLIGLSERIVNRMPVVRSIYGPTKQIFEMVLAQKSTAFRDVVMVEFPRIGQWSIGFITGVTEGEVQELTEDEVVNVYIPTTPNPTSGFLIFVPRRDVIPLSMSAEEGIKMVVSGGLVTPPDRRPPELRKQKQHSVPSRAAPPIKNAGE